MVQNRKLLVPEVRKEVDQLKAKIANSNEPDNAKFETAKELGIPFKNGYNGNLTSHQAGKIGGKLGGNMVREMIKLAEQTMKN